MPRLPICLPWPWPRSHQPRPLCPFQICPALNHAGLVLLNSLLDTVPGELLGPVGDGEGVMEPGAWAGSKGAWVTDPIPTQ